MAFYLSKLSGGGGVSLGKGQDYKQFWMHVLQMILAYCLALMLSVNIILGSLAFWL